MHQDNRAVHQLYAQGIHGICRTPSPPKKPEGDKPRFHLLPSDALGEIQKVLEYGDRKYAPSGWQSGAPWCRYWNAALRHLWAWVRRENVDPESGLSHLAHAAASIMILLAYELRKVGEDDRPPAATPNQ